MNVSDAILSETKAWLTELSQSKSLGGLPYKGTIAIALVALEHLRTGISFELKDYQADDGVQITGASGRAVRMILARYGVEKHFLSEGGLTSRGAPKTLSALLERFRQIQMESASTYDRVAGIELSQAFLASQVELYFRLDQIMFEFEPDSSLWRSIHQILNVAESRNQAGPVAKYLVGAKLTLRFPELAVRNSSFSTSDIQTGQHGDFQLGSTVFHVTVHPTSGHFEKIKQNLQQGFRSYLIVPNILVEVSRQWATQFNISDQLSIHAVESFISLNIDEIGNFERGHLLQMFRKLLETYNTRVLEVESDNTLLIRIPSNL